MDMGPVTLVVKAPNHRIEDKTIAGDMGWTVRKLKEHISSIYPERPHEDQQKLVYYGKLLQDESYLKDVLKQDSYGGAHTLHLVCPQHTKATSKPIINTTQFTEPPQTAELRQRITTTSPLIQSQQYNGSMPSAPLTADQLGNMTAQQRLWMQMYNQQMTLYNMYYQQMAAMQTQTESPVNDTTPIEEPAAAPPGPAAAAAAPEAVVLNAQGGIDADDGQRDWLDSIYSIFRLSMLMTLLYFYTTFGRFTVVIAATLFFYIAQGGVLRLFAIQRRRGNADRVAAGNVQQEQNRAENQNNENEERNGSEVSSDEDDSPAEATPANQESAFIYNGRIALTFIFTFFSSLIPQNPAVAN